MFPDCVFDKDAIRKQMYKAEVPSFVQLARELGINDRQFSRWLNGAPFSSRALALIATRLRIHPGKIIKLTEREQPYYHRGRSVPSKAPSDSHTSPFEGVLL